jgi:hypothetical protein
MASLAARAIRRAAAVGLALLATALPARGQEPPPPGPVTPAPGAAPAPAAGQASPPTIVHPHGPQYGYPDPDDPERFVWVFLGGVEIEQAERRLVGDTLVVVLRAAGEPTSTLVEPPAGVTLFGGDRLLELYLDGNVRVEEGPEQISGASAFHLDATTGVASVVQGELRTDVHEGLPLVARFALLKRLQDGTAFMKDVTYTNCEYERPHWHVRTPYARLKSTPDGRVLSTGSNVAVVGGVPLLWLPGVDLNVDGGGLLISQLHVGSSSRFGTMIQTKWRGDASPLAGAAMGLFGNDAPVRADFDLGVSWLSKRGGLFEPELEYRTEHSKGKLFGSYIHDTADEDHLGQPITDHHRWWTKVEHRTRIDEHQTLDIEVSKQSDENYLNEYYESEAKEDKPQETVRLVPRRRRQPRHDGAHEHAAQRLPDAGGLRARGRRAAGGPGAAGRLLHDGQGVRVQRRAQAGGRLARRDHARPAHRRRRAAHAALGPAQRRPRRVPHAARPHGLRRHGRRRQRAAHSVGAGLQWSRTYSGIGEASSETWNLDGLRRIVEPRISIFDRFEVSMDPGELIQIDQVEQLDEVTVVELGLRDRIQTHQDGQVVTLLDTDLALPYFPRVDREDVGDVDDGLGPMRLDSTWRPAADVFGLRQAEIHWRAQLDLEAEHYRQSFASYSTKLGPARRFGISQNAVENEFVYRTVGFAWKLSPKWDTAVYYQQNAETNSTARAGFLLRQVAHCWYIDFELSTRQADDINGTSQPDEVEFALRLTPAVLEHDANLVDQIGGRIP